MSKFQNILLISSTNFNDCVPDYFLKEREKIMYLL